MREILDKRADTISNIVEQAWFSRYPWPTQIIFDRGKRFMAEFSIMVQEDYGLKIKPTTTRNTQANAIIERIHQVIGNMIRTFEIQKMDLDEKAPWKGILVDIMFDLRATFHTTLEATPMQLLFGRDAMLNVQFQADWKYIKD